MMMLLMYALSSCVGAGAQLLCTLVMLLLAITFRMISNGGAITYSTWCIFGMVIYAVCGLIGGGVCGLLVTMLYPILQTTNNTNNNDNNTSASASSSASSKNNGWFIPVVLTGIMFPAPFLVMMEFIRHLQQPQYYHNATTSLSSLLLSRNQSLVGNWMILPPRTKMVCIL